MKSAYELAMERLDKTAPIAKLTTEQKKAIAELESKCKAKIAEREIALQSEIAAATAAEEFEKAEEFRQQLSRERQTLLAGLEEKKEQIHEKSGRK